MKMYKNSTAKNHNALKYFENDFLIIKYGDVMISDELCDDSSVVIFDKRTEESYYIVNDRYEYGYTIYDDLIDFLNVNNTFTIEEILLYTNL